MNALPFRSVSILRPDDPALSDETQGRIQVYRLLGLVAGSYHVLLPRREPVPA